MKHLYYPFGLARAFPTVIPMALEAYDYGDILASATLAAGDVKISLDFGAFADLATLPDVEPGTGVLKQIRIILAEAELDFTVATIQFVDQTAQKEWEDVCLHLHTRPNPVFKVVADGSNSATSFEVTPFGMGTEATDYLKDMFLTGLDGALKGQTKLVTGYNATSNFVTVSGGYTGTPADGTYFEGVNR